MLQNVNYFYNESRIVRRNSDATPVFKIESTELTVQFLLHC